MSNDTIRGTQIDLQGLNLNELLAKIGGSQDKIDDLSVKTALDMILYDQDQVANHGFNNYI